MLTRRSDQGKGTAVSAVARDNQGSRAVGAALDQGTHWKAATLKRSSSGSGKVRGCVSRLGRARAVGAAAKVKGASRGGGSEGGSGG